jgi:hypothetical protein
MWLGWCEELLGWWKLACISFLARCLDLGREGKGSLKDIVWLLEVANNEFEITWFLCLGKRTTHKVHQSSFPPNTVPVSPRRWNIRAVIAHIRLPHPVSGRNVM